MIESSTGLSVDMETTIEFTNGGGAYLPGLDDNFVTDRTVTLPMVCDPSNHFSTRSLTVTGPHGPF